MRFVFQIKVKQGHTVDEYVEAWEQASAVSQDMHVTTPPTGGGCAATYAGLCWFTKYPGIWFG